MLPAIQELADYRHWVGWVMELKDGKLAKVPIGVNCQRAYSPPGTSVIATSPLRGCTLGECKHCVEQLPLFWPHQFNNAIVLQYRSNE